MKNQIEIVKNIADGMIGICETPSNEEFYAEFDTRLRTALNLKDDKVPLPADKLIESLGEPSEGNEYTIKPNKDGQWWIEHKVVGSGEPLRQFLLGKPGFEKEGGPILVQWPESQDCIGCPKGCFIDSDDERIGSSAYLCFKTHSDCPEKEAEE